LLPSDTSDQAKDRVSVSLTVCPNGMGHAVRSLRVMRELVTLGRGFRLTAVALSPTQHRSLHPATRAWLEAEGTRILHGVTEPGVSLERDPAAYGDGRLLDWEARWAATPQLSGADLVVSDNLVGVLSRRADAVLMGSFLWSDVLDEHPDVHGVARDAVMAFVDHERQLLARCSPPMLCTADVASDGVLARTSAVPLAWFDERSEQPDDAATRPLASQRVAVIGGGTGAQARPLEAIAARLRDAGWEILAHLPEPGEPGVAAVVCRPGLGTVTECVLRAFPMVLVRETWNPELAHTAAALVRLGVAVDLGSADPLAVLRHIVDTGAGRRMVRSLRARPTGGHRAAAVWLAERVTSMGPAEGEPAR
jgi:hypothetical protein